MKNIDIIFEDNDILIVNKPSGLLTIPDRYDLEQPCLANILKEKYGEMFVVHRLDKDTSGIMIFAKNADSHRNLNTQFQDHKVQKIYHAVVSGIVSKDYMEIDIPLMANPGKKGGVVPSARGKESMTLMKVIERYRGITYVKCNLVTGRQHQLRAHVAAVGHPLLVDEMYGNSTEFFLSSIKKKFNLRKNETEKPIISRITMHAYSLTFDHPVTNAEMEFVAEFPKDFRVLLQVLQKYAGN